MPSELMDKRTRLEYEFWDAVVELEAGNRKRAIEGAASVLSEAESEGFARIFLDGGRPAERLLRLVEQTCPTAYVGKLIELAEADSGTVQINGLSQRELDVVRFLPTPLSSAEIASSLFISLNTLKSHLRSIYRKFGVSGRREAARYAEGLGIA